MKKLIVDTQKLAQNIETIKTVVSVPIIGVVKGNGYGLSIIPYSLELLKNGINFFAVSEVEEALKLKNCEQFSECDVILMTPIYDREVIGELIEKGIILTVSNIETAQLIELEAQSKAVVPRIHIKIDTGFGRYGFSYKNKEEITKVYKFSNISISGIYTHFSSSFEKEYKITKQQFEHFQKVIAYLKSLGFTIPMTHCANSCAALRFKQTHLDAVRIGSGFLGRLPVNCGIKLNKIGYLQTKIIDTNIISKGENIGYGNIFSVAKDTPTATVLIGFKDGFMIEKSDDIFRFIDILRYIYNDIRSFNKSVYLYDSDGEKYKILGHVGMYSTTIQNVNNRLSIKSIINADINPLLVNDGIKREYGLPV